MGSLWDDRLAEVWAPPGRPGSGVVFGVRGVLTARHVVASADGGIKARVVRHTQVRVGSWVPMRVVWEDENWDLALLAVQDGEPGAHNWLVPATASPVIARLAGRAEADCEAIGFPDQEVQRSEVDGAGLVRRQTEQVSGMLLPSGQAKAPVGVGRRLPRSWMPMDVGSSTASAAGGWGGMSGSGVMLHDGRLAAIVVAVDHEHQQRRMYCVPLAEVLDASPEFGAALGRLTGAPAQAQARHSAAFRRALLASCLGLDGMPSRLNELDDLGVFGVKSIELPGEPRYLRYVRRDGDNELSRALTEGAQARRMVLVVGKSGAGKSRSTAEAVRRQFPRHRLLRPIEGMLTELIDLPLDDVGSTLVWLDDIERYQHGGLGEMLRRLLLSGVVVVGTIRSDELAVLTESHNPVGEALTDPSLVRRVEWQREWSEAERSRVPTRVAHPALRQATAMRIALGVWCVAGHQLIQRSLNTEPDDYPCRGFLMRAVLDWYRTGLTAPIPRLLAYELVEQAYLSEPARLDELDAALDWALAPVDVGGRRSAHSLLMADTNAGMLTANDYVRDFDNRDTSRPVPKPVWEAALRVASGDDDALSAIGWRALALQEHDLARLAFAPLARAGQADAMGVLGLLTLDEDADEGTRWIRRAAETGDANALRNYGEHLRLNDPGSARVWFERAAEAGSVTAMVDLGGLLEDNDPPTAEEWFRRAAEAGDDEAMNRLAVMVQEQAPDQARVLYLQAAETGNLLAMNNLGLLLFDRDEDQALRWFRKAAEAGNDEAMNNLANVLAVRGDHPGSVEWLQRAADAGNAEAMRNLGIELSQAGLNYGARYWWLRADQQGNTDALLNLAVLAANLGDADGYRSWLARGVEAGSAMCMYALGHEHAQNGETEAAHRLYKQAAEAGEPSAMAALGALLEDQEQALPWLRRAAAAGNADGMYELGRRLLDHGNLADARDWWMQAAGAGNTEAADAVGHALLDEDPAAALPWLQTAAGAGHADAMATLARLLSQSDPAAASRWRQTSDAHAATQELLARNADPDRCRQALLRAVRDWSRTGLEKGLPRAVAFDLVNYTYLEVPSSTEELEDALAWALSPVRVEDRRTNHSLVYQADESDGLKAVDIDDGRQPAPVPEPVWDAALRAAGDDAEARSAIGWQALKDEQWAIARRAFEPLANAGRADSMGLYGLLISEEDPAAASRWIERAARTGDVNSMLNYGTHLLTGGGDLEAARYWLRQAAEAGSATAMQRLGDLLIDDDPDEAQLWLRTAADAGEADAMNTLGLLASDEDPEAGREWYRRAAYDGNLAAMNNLGLAQHDEDPDSAKLWFRLAAEAGMGAAMRNLAIVLLDDDPPTARRWLEQAASRGDAAALYNLGVLVMDEDPIASDRYWQEAADLGDPDAMNNLALRLVHDERFNDAQDLLERAVEFGNVNAMNSLGSLLSRRGRIEEARNWWEHAADNGDPNAMYNLGKLLYDAEDTAGAISWWQQAAEAGSPAAMTGLAQLLYEDDPESSRSWLEKAAKEGDNEEQFTQHD